MEGLAPLLHLPVIKELGRERLPERTPENSGPFRRAILNEQVEQEKQLQAYLSDRSTVDCWAIWTRWEICCARVEDTESFYNDAKTQALNYSHIIYVPPMFAIEGDGSRWANSDYQKQIDRNIRTTLWEWGLAERTYTVTSTVQKDRVEEVTNWLLDR